MSVSPQNSHTFADGYRTALEDVRDLDLASGGTVDIYGTWGIRRDNAVTITPEETRRAHHRP